MKVRDILYSTPVIGEWYELVKVDDNYGTYSISFYSQTNLDLLGDLNNFEVVKDGWIKPLNDTAFYQLSALKELGYLCKKSNPNKRYQFGNKTWGNQRHGVLS